MANSALRMSDVVDGELEAVPCCEEDMYVFYHNALLSVHYLLHQEIKSFSEDRCANKTRLVKSCNKHHFFDAHFECVKKKKRECSRRVRACVPPEDFFFSTSCFLGRRKLAGGDTSNEFAASRVLVLRAGFRKGCNVVMSQFSIHPRTIYSARYAERRVNALLEQTYL